MMLPALDDTIVAVATPPGSGACGVIRVSGPLSPDITAALFRTPTSWCWAELNRPIRLAGRVAPTADRYVLPAHALVFKAPRSYTRQDVVEFHVVGSPAVMAALVERICSLGARPGGPGEFTARAFRHGALSVDDVQGIAALIHARSDEQLRVANEWIGNRLGQAVGQQRAALIRIRALVEAEIDFSEEPVEFISATRLESELRHIVGELERLQTDVRDAERAVAPPRVMLVGRPNVGKSTLLNRLSGIDRALCSAVTGSTRDVLSAIARVGQLEIELLDTPGRGVSTRKKQKNANFFEPPLDAPVNLICHLLEVGKRPLEEQVLDVSAPPHTAMIWVVNKADLVAPDTLKSLLESWSDQLSGTVVAVSARTGAGCAALGAEIARHLTKNVGNHSIAVAPVHAHALSEALDSLARACSWCAQSDDVTLHAEFIASDLHNAVQALSTLFGEVTPDDLLQRIFDEFCIGK